MTGMKDEILVMQKLLICANVFTALCPVPLVIIAINLITRAPIVEMVSLALALISGT